MKLYKSIFDKLKPEVFFVIFGCLFGFIILFVTPPFQVPDEINHFYRAYQISEGQMKALKQNSRLGGYVPKSLVKITEPFLGLRWNMNAKTNFETIIDQLQTPLDANNKIFVDFPNTSVYSPVSYFPQSISILVLRKFNLPPLYIFYCARISALLFWLLSIFHAIRTMPFYKWFFTFLALLPMSLFINMSLSADVVTNLLSFNLIACIFKLAYVEQNISLKNIIIPAVMAIFLVTAKFVYAPIVLLFLLIPKSKWNTDKDYYTQAITFISIFFVTILIGSKSINDLYLPYNVYNKNFRDGITLVQCADMHEQIHYILNHGSYLWHVFGSSMKHTFDMYYQGYIGTLGWIDTKFPIWFIHLSYLILFTIALLDNGEAIKLNMNDKFIILIDMIIIIGLILLSQHLTWDCVGGDIIANLQGRYFIPVFPLFFMLFYNRRINYPNVAISIVCIFSFFSLLFTTYTLYMRYYTIY
jgi:uncharacterized membrane protein